MDKKTQLAIVVGVLVIAAVAVCATSEKKCPDGPHPTPGGADASPQASTDASVPGCYAAGYCQPSMEAFYPETRGKTNPYAMPKHDPGHDIFGYSLNNNYCRYGLGQTGIVDGENDLWRFQIYTVQPSMVNLKFQKVMM